MQSETKMHPTKRRTMQVIVKLGLDMFECGGEKPANSLESSNHIFDRPDGSEI